MASSPPSDPADETTTLIRRAADILRAGGLVAFPTETVYGLGADATNIEAVAKIFAAKGRPPTNPLIVHVADLETATRYAAEWNDAAQMLGAVWWPGPLALVVSKRPEIVDAVTARRPTVALRVPDHPLALQLLREFGGPVAAPSANKSNRVSPTTAQHVRDELGGAVDLVLDGGPCAVGIESTVVDLTGGRPVILRPGGVPREKIEAIVGPVELFAGAVEATDAAASPGQHATHYAPRTPAFRIPFLKWSEAVRRAKQLPPGRQVLLAFNLPGGEGPGATSIAMPHEPTEYARRLYAALRDADGLGAACIVIEMPPAEAPWEAVRDRINRATRPL